MTVRRIVANLTAAGPERARPFYEQLLGAEPPEQRSMNANGDHRPDKAAPVRRRMAWR